MAKIFINYRRKDSAPYAGRLYDRLAGHFGPDHVFMDIDQIEPGEVFDQVIQEKLKAVQAAVVLIGEHWLDIADADGQRRLDHPDDWVRLEIAAVLERNIRVIPVLVGGAAMPKSTQLLESLAPLTRRQAIEITDHRFHTDTDKLIKALEKIVGVPPLKPTTVPQQQVQEQIVSMLPPRQSESPKVPEEQEKPGFLRFAGIAGAVGIVLATGLYFWGMLKPTPIQQESEDPAIETIATIVSTEAAVIEPEMMRIEPGKFLMGAPTSDADSFDGERPQHEVTINYAFEISKYEVTFNEYDAFANVTKRELPSDSSWGRGKRPVINVSWNDAQAYVKWLSEQKGKKYRLPTEAEWEYAARAGAQTRFWWGKKVGKNNAVCDGCGSQWDNKQTAPVGSFKPNPFGLYDTSGNVLEWVQDCWHENYNNAPKDGSAWLEKDDGYCLQRVIRSGSWNIPADGVRSAFRLSIDDRVASRDIGFRIARDF